MTSSTAIPDTEFSLPTYFSVKVFGKYTVMSLGKKPEKLTPATRLIPVTRSFFNPERLRFLADLNEAIIYSGIVLLVAPLLFMYFGIRDAILFDGQAILMQCLLAGAIGLRAISLFWIARLAWVNKVVLQDQLLLAIFLPATALLITGFTFGEPVQYIEMIADQQVAEPELVTEETAISAAAEQMVNPAAVATFPAYAPAPAYVNTRVNITAEELNKRQALEEAELARIAS